MLFRSGIVGYSGLSNVTNCENRAEVIGNYNGIGGIIGGSTVAGERIIEKCFNYGTIRYNGIAVSQNEYARGVGGIIGFISGRADVLNCENNGEIEANVNCCGGIIGLNLSADVKDCINSGKVSRRILGRWHSWRSPKFRKYAYWRNIWM